MRTANFNGTDSAAKCSTSLEQLDLIMMECMEQALPLAVFESISLPPHLVCGVQADKERSFFGTTTTNLADKAAAFIVSNAAIADKAALTEVLATFLVKSIEDCRACAAEPIKVTTTDSCWLAVRMNRPHDVLVLARWHQDGRVFRCSCSVVFAVNEIDRDGGDYLFRVPHSKYAITLLGPATRVLALHKAVLDISHSIDEEFGFGLTSEQDLESRHELQQRIKGCPAAREVSIRLGQPIRFSWGQADSPLHSEPDVSNDERIFACVVFGREAEIRDMCKVKDAEYGRSTEE